VEASDQGGDDRPGFRQFEAGLRPVHGCGRIPGLEGEVTGARRDAGCEWCVAGGVSEGQGSSEVAPCHSILARVVGHPSRHLREHNGSTTSGYLPAWAEDDPTEAGVSADELHSRLAQINHRSFFEGPTMPVVAPDLWDGVEEDAVLEGSIDCNPYDEDPRLRVPVVNLQISPGRWIPALAPQDLAEVASKLRSHADLLDQKVRPALIAAREDWAARHPRRPL
jgi:hypothetical protein